MVQKSLLRVSGMLGALFTVQQEAAEDSLIGTVTFVFK